MNTQEMIEVVRAMIRTCICTELDPLERVHIVNTNLLNLESALSESKVVPKDSIVLTGIYAKPISQLNEVMIERLVANQHKGGWDDCEFEYLMRRLKQETEELDSALKRLYRRQTEKNWLEIKREAADIANFAMMIIDGVIAENRPPACEKERLING